MPALYSVTLVELDGGLVASMVGELDLASAPAAFAEVAVGAGDRPVVLDLSGVPFIDSSGIGQLVLLARTTSVRVVVAPDSQPERVMAITGIPAAIPCFASVAEALGASLEP